MKYPSGKRIFFPLLSLKGITCLRTLFLSGFLIVFSFYSAAQDTILVMIKQKTGKEKFITENKRVVVVTDSTVSHGELGYCDSSRLMAGTDTVFLSDIRSIKARSLASKVLGWALTGYGATLFATGIVVIVHAYSVGGFYSGIVIALIGAPAIAGGILLTGAGVIVLATGMKHKSPRWKYEIRMQPDYQKR